MVMPSSADGHPHGLDNYRLLKRMAAEGVVVRLKKAKGPDYYAGIEFVFPGKEPIYFGLDIPADFNKF